MSFEIAVMFSPEFHLNTLLFTLPQMFLMLYVINLRSENGLRDFELGSPGFSTLLPALCTFLLMFGITTALGMLAELAGLFTSLDLRNPAMPVSMPENISLPTPLILSILILGTSAAIGYFEELFFRVYLVGQFSRTSRGPHIVILISSVLFAGGHLYQGLIGGIGTFLIGLLLGYRYLRCRNLHEIALAHTLYNFTIIMLIPFGV